MEEMNTPMPGAETPEEETEDTTVATPVEGDDADLAEEDEMAPEAAVEEGADEAV